MRSLGKEVNINPPLTLGQLPDTPEELLKLDQVHESFWTQMSLLVHERGALFSHKSILCYIDPSLTCQLRKNHFRLFSLTY